MLGQLNMHLPLQLLETLCGLQMGRQQKFLAATNTEDPGNNVVLLCSSVHMVKCKVTLILVNI